MEEEQKQGNALQGRQEMVEQFINGMLYKTEAMKDDRAGIKLQYQQAVNSKADWFRLKQIAKNDFLRYLVFLKGPDGSPYEGRWFKINITLVPEGLPDIV